MVSSSFPEGKGVFLKVRQQFDRIDLVKTSVHLWAFKNKAYALQARIWVVKTMAKR